MRHRTLVLAAAGLAAAATAVGVAVAAADDSDARTFSAHVTNPWFPLRPGTRWVYTGVKDGKRVARRRHGDARHADDPRRALHRRRATGSTSAGRLEERTTDWYSQDDGGQRLVLRRGHRRARRARPRHEHRGHLARGPATARRPGSSCRPTRASASPPAGVLEGPRRGSLPRRLRPLGRNARADAGVDAARAGRARPQALRARGRHRARADRARRRRADELVSVTGARRRRRGPAAARRRRRRGRAGPRRRPAWRRSRARAAGRWPRPRARSARRGRPPRPERRRRAGRSGGRRRGRAPRSGRATATSSDATWSVSAPAWPSSSATGRPWCCSSRIACSSPTPPRVPVSSAVVATTSRSSSACSDSPSSARWRRAK